jgi:hypothetical protein
MRAFSAISRLAADQGGAAMMAFALAVPTLLAGMGLAVDYAYLSRGRAGLQSAADSAALNAARELIISEPTLARVQVIAKRTVDSILSEAGKPGKPGNWFVSSALTDSNKSVVVEISRPMKPIFAKVYAMLGLAQDPLVVTASATARLAHNSKLCMVLTESTGAALVLERNARLTGLQCSIHSNSRSSMGIRLAEGSKIAADLVCSRGGISNQGSTVQTEILNDCPPVLDPLRARVAPAPGPCIFPSRQVFASGLVTLNPGTYCGGIEARGTAVLQLNPGIYFFSNGDLTVQGDAEIRGQNVGLYFKGAASYFRFRDNALVELSGPKDGAMVGLLLWRDRANNVADKAAGLASSAANAITANRAT